MNTPSSDLPPPKITTPLSFQPVKRAEKDKSKKRYLDDILQSGFVRSYFKKKK